MLSGHNKGLAFNTIVIMALCLLVMVIMSAIYASRAGLFQKGTDNIRDSNTRFCGKEEGVCVQSACTGASIPGDFVDCKAPASCCK